MSITVMRMLCSQSVLCLLFLLPGGIAYYYEYITTGNEHVALAGTEMTSPDTSNITFKVNGCYGAVLHFLSRDFSYTYKFEIETERGNTSKITKYSTSSGSITNWKVENDTSHITLMKCNKNKKILISWEDGFISVGHGKRPTKNTFLSAYDADSTYGLEISSISSEENVTITWIFGDNLTESMETTSLFHSTNSETSQSMNTDITKLTSSQNNIFTSGLSTVRSEEHTMSTEDQSATTLNNKMASEGISSYNYVAMTSSDSGNALLNTGITAESTTSKKSTTLCSCECHNSLDLQTKLKYIRRNLKLNKVELSSALRRKKSSPDSRMSSRYLGYLGISVIVGVCACILLADITSMRNRNSRVKPLSKRNRV